ncbi:transcription elongation factor GreA [Elusimicrobiota bacterium]
MGRLYLTRAGSKKLQKDLADLKKYKSELSKEVGEAREKGDLKENAEYHAAKDRLGEIMQRIGKIEEQLSSAEMVDDLEIKKDEVQIGVTVSLLDTESQTESSWTLVGQVESEPGEGRISVDSPLAQGLLGHKVGEEVPIELPAGTKTFKILKTEAAV